jgi:hypothetical protein
MNALLVEYKCSVLEKLLNICCGKLYSIVAIKSIMTIDSAHNLHVVVFNSWRKYRNNKIEFVYAFRSVTLNDPCFLQYNAFFVSAVVSVLLKEQFRYVPLIG